MKTAKEIREMMDGWKNIEYYLRDIETYIKRAAISGEFVLKYSTNRIPSNYVSSIIYELEKNGYKVNSMTNDYEVDIIIIRWDD